MAGRGCNKGVDEYRGFLWRTQAKKVSEECHGPSFHCVEWSSVTVSIVNDVVNTIQQRLPGLKLDVTRSMAHQAWDVIRCVTSPNGSGHQYFFATSDCAIEASLHSCIDVQPCVDICVSTMSGCPMGCRFCGAGRYYVRNLSANEIVSQVQVIHSELLGRSEWSSPTKLIIRTVSMGEPLLNTSVWSALRTLSMMHPHAHFVVSTSAPDIDWSWVFEMGQEITGIELQFSVHESTNPVRNQLMPFKRKLSLEQIADRGERWFQATARRPSFNYCVHEQNVTAEDAKNLRELFDPAVWTATLSSIFERTIDSMSDTQRSASLANDFSKILTKHGFSVRVAKPLDSEAVGSECGQLWSFQNWATQHSDVARESSGHRALAARACRGHTILPHLEIQKICF